MLFTAFTRSAKTASNSLSTETQRSDLSRIWKVSPFLSTLHCLSWARTIDAVKSTAAKSNKVANKEFFILLLLYLNEERNTTYNDGRMIQTLMKNSQSENRFGVKRGKLRARMLFRGAKILPMIRSG